jgi:hypothetical protein
VRLVSAADRARPLVGSWPSVNWDKFVQLAADGLTTGSVYALIALRCRSGNWSRSERETAADVIGRPFPADDGRGRARADMRGARSGSST